MKKNAETEKLVSKLTSKFRKILIKERTLTNNREPVRSVRYRVRVDNIELSLCYDPAKMVYLIGANDFKRKMIIEPPVFDRLDELIEDVDSLENLMNGILKSFDVCEAETNEKKP